MTDSLGGLFRFQQEEAARMSRMHEDFSRVIEQQAAERHEAQEAPTARRAVQQLLKEIRAFEMTLRPNEEVGFAALSTSANQLLHLRSVSFHQPNLVVLEAELEGGRRARVIQHVTQLNVLLMAVEAIDKDEPRRPVGFHEA